MRHLGVSWANTNLPRPLVAVLSDLSQDSCMAMTPKVAVAALLVASLTAGCSSGGSSGAEIEAACWAQREAIAAEMLVWAAMDDTTASIRGNGLGGSHVKSYNIEKLEDSMPDC